jgi:hypothetical protein
LVERRGTGDPAKPWAVQKLVSELLAALETLVKNDSPTKLHDNVRAALG